MGVIDLMSEEALIDYLDHSRRRRL